MKVGIIGNGVVGGVIRRYIENHNYGSQILIYDPRLGYLDKMHLADIVFISVPVNTIHFKQDLSILKESIERCPEVPIFIRSSVLPGTCDKLAHEMGRFICSFPEYLTERTAYDDFVSASTHVIGICSGTDPLLRDWALQRLVQCLPHKTFKQVLPSEAELIKYTHNSFGALKVTYFNGIYDLAEKYGCDYEVIRKWVPKVTGFINENHMQVPGPDGKRGFGGMCFPKDLAALMGDTSPNMFYKLLESVYTLNCHYRETRDFPGIG